MMITDDRAVPFTNDRAAPVTKGSLEMIEREA
jgi:hypothetical protein